MTLLLLEYIQVKGNGFEKFLTGKSIIVIQNGKLNVPELKKLRMTVDQLEMRLRTSGISKIEDVKTATLEPNGQLGYELAEEAQTLTVGEFKKVMSMYMAGNSSQPAENEQNIFSEIKQVEKPKYLQ